MEIVDEEDREPQLALPAIAAIGAVRSCNFRQKQHFGNDSDFKIDVEGEFSPVFKSNPLPIFLKVKRVFFSWRNKKGKKNFFFARAVRGRGVLCEGAI